MLLIRAAITVVPSGIMTIWLLSRTEANSQKNRENARVGDAEGKLHAECSKLGPTVREEYWRIDQAA